jgi:hypothetical protein
LRGGVPFEILYYSYYNEFELFYVAKEIVLELNNRGKKSGGVYDKATELKAAEIRAKLKGKYN